MMKEETTRSATENLKLGLVKRAVLLIFGFLASVTVLEVLPLLLHLVPANPEVSTRTRPYVDTVPISAFVEPVVTLVLLGLLAYGVYDAIRMLMRYRRSQQDDQQMFP